MNRPRQSDLTPAILQGSPATITMPSLFLSKRGALLHACRPPEESSFWNPDRQSDDSGGHAKDL
ncbi:uncharacterized protein PgNI_02230 [Pyricularia grisea]|uniref:Uncharacterized protein n=1 Tax=Pyricularia grisea TaxID=148305 RepID=A0A6P8BKL3_PYRGI|nr:uncharacterized protein PgNI_02230 [Pyricularia grisea]TLD17333.1 hypothetical protein PgNI_02230 [Pyricularia grisea]